MLLLGTVHEPFEAGGSTWVMRGVSPTQATSATGVGLRRGIGVRKVATPQNGYLSRPPPRHPPVRSKRLEPGFPGGRYTRAPESSAVEPGEGHMGNVG